MTFALLLFVSSAASAQQPSLMPRCAAPNQESWEANARGEAAHLDRCLTAASLNYSKALELAPPRQPSAEERAILLRFAPRLLITPSEPFPLKDFGAILHPTGRWIAYHLFWEDDIDFPDDNDPCDHEVIWVKMTAQHDRVENYYTYFHGRIIEAPPAAVTDANRNGGRPAIWIQWGKHGSMPAQWNRLEAENRPDYQRLSTTGRRSASSPLGRGWPLRFSGSWNNFTDYSRDIDSTDWLRKYEMILVSAFSNAAINRHFLRYNFSAKNDWPDRFCP